MKYLYCADTAVVLNSGETGTALDLDLGLVRTPAVPGVPDRVQQGGGTGLSSTRGSVWLDSVLRSSDVKD